jgi:hypothetical protein
MKIIPWILCVLLGFFLILSLARPRIAEPVIDYVRIDSVVHDTLVVYKPKLVFSDVVRHDTVLLVTTSNDTVHVDMPIESKEYADSSYRAWVSGFHVALDSIQVYPATVYRTRIMKAATSKKRFGIGVQVGYGYPTGFYAGVGVSYNLFSF